MKKSNRIVTGGFAVTLAVYVIEAAVCFLICPLAGSLIGWCRW